ncbi:MAG: surface antigen [Acidobacteriaceae bacterium]|nr:surface antigen [Acidobacteriaceae bacterium]
MPSFLRLKLQLKAIICTGLLVLTLGISLSAAAQQTLVQEIVPHGNRRIPGETIKARMFTHPGDVYDEASIQRDFSALWNTGYFEDLRIEKENSAKGVIIHVYVKEKPTIRSIDYLNLNSVTKSDVLERFKKDKVGLSVENQYDPTKIKKAEVTLRELLAEHGRQFATIRTEIHPIPPAAVGVTFNIKEGPKVKVGKIKFEGNKNLNTRTLRAAMKNSKPVGIPHSIVLENIFARTYDSTKLQEDAERVRESYQEKGFFKALVGDPKTEMRDTGGGLRINPFGKGKVGKAVDITIPVDEGDRYKLGSITFKNGKAVTNMKALRNLFPLKDGELINVASLRKGIENLRKAYGELGYINFTGVPDMKINEEKKIIDVEVDLDEGKSYLVRRIEFVGNTTTRDKVIRRELAVEEGNVYNSRLWEFSLLRLNQLQYFDPLKPDQDSETKRNDTDATVDLTLKVKEKGKNSIGLTGGVSGLAGSFVGLNYQTNNFLGLGETLTVEANVGSRERNLLFGFTEPYLFDRPLQLGFTVFTRRYDYNQAKENSIALNQQLNLPQSVLDTLQNFSQSTTGFTTSLSYPLRRSLKRIGLTYSFDTSTVTTFSTASQDLFSQLAFRNVSGPDALKGVITSKLIPSFSYSNIDNPQRPHRGKSIFAGGEISGIGGNVAAIRPIVEWKQYIPMHNFRPNSEGRQTLGYRIQGSFITGYRGLVAPPQERFYSGGDNDLRGFDTRTISPYIFLSDKVNITLTNPDGSAVPVDPANPLRGNVTIPIPIQRITVPGGDTNIVTNLEYRVPIAGPVTIAAFADGGLNFVARGSQLKLTDTQVTTLNTTLFGGTCSTVTSVACTGGQMPGTPGGLPLFSSTLSTIPGTNFVPRVSTGLELQVILPIVNAPFRIYYAYNPLLLDTTTNAQNQITRNLFPAGAAGDFTFHQALQSFAPNFVLKEPRKTFRFTVATTF